MAVHITYVFLIVATGLSLNALAPSPSSGVPVDRERPSFGPHFFDWIAEDWQRRRPQQRSDGELLERDHRGSDAFDESSLLPVKLQQLIAFNEQAIKALQDKPGSWPFKQKAECEKSYTRDSQYNEHHNEKDDLVKQLRKKYPRCGITRKSQTDSSIDDEEDDVENVDGSSEDRASASVDDVTDFHPLTAIKLKSIVNNQTPRSKQRSEVDAEKLVKSHSARIIGGHTTRKGEWPWLAAIGQKAAGPKCGGSLIADRWVLTAAHCFKDRERVCEYNVRVGSRNWMYDERNLHQDLDIEAIYRHPKYNSDDNSNDIALLKLSKSVALDEQSPINAVCLPKRSRSVEVGTECIAAGWGKVEDSSKADVLDSRQVEIPVVSYTDTCGSYDNGTIKEGMICAGYMEGGRDTCQGDSGGPLIYRNRNQWTLLGITSFGEGCAKKRYPGIYTDVGHYIHWVASVIDRHSDTI